jgi:hypothetical protein
MNTVVKSPVWHLDVLRVQLTNCEPCHGRERRLTRIGEWETNNEEEINHTEKRRREMLESGLADLLQNGDAS